MNSALGCVFQHSNIFYPSTFDVFHFNGGAICIVGGKILCRRISYNISGFLSFEEAMAALEHAGGNLYILDLLIKWEGHGAVPDMFGFEEVILRGHVE